MPSYRSIHSDRRDGVTELRFHTDDGPLVWSALVHQEAPSAFAEVASDPETKVLVVTGTGDAFCSQIDFASFFGERRTWEPTWWEGKRLLRTLLDIDVPIIGCVNGPAFYHAEIPLLADIVVAADTATLADKAHAQHGAVPGDGVHVVWPYLLGPRRAKYFLLMGQEISALQALDLGVVNEVLPAADVRERAHAIARDLAARSMPFLRYTREVLNVVERRQLLADLSHGLALEGLGFADDARLRRRS
jgi:enoyl-CoA hydratase/carnithine racemase